MSLRFSKNSDTFGSAGRMMYTASLLTCYYYPWHLRNELLLWQCPNLVHNQPITTTTSTIHNEAFVLEFLENSEDMFPLYYTYSDLQLWYVIRL